MLQRDYCEKGAGVPDVMRRGNPATGQCCGTTLASTDRGLCSLAYSLSLSIISVFLILPFPADQSRYLLDLRPSSVVSSGSFLLSPVLPDHSHLRSNRRRFPAHSLSLYQPLSISENPLDQCYQWLGFWFLPPRRIKAVVSFGSFLLNLFCPDHSHLRPIADASGAFSFFCASRSQSVKIRLISVISGEVLVCPAFRYHSFVMTPHPLTLAQKASRLLDLHHGSQPLVLINAWDAASAAMVEHCGLPAIATSSAAMANALGFPDGQYLPWPQMLEAVARVCRAVKVPVTADIESGFAANVTALEASISQIIQAGAVGVNLEDVMSANPAHQNTGHQSANPENADAENADAKNRDPHKADPKPANPVRHGSPLFPLSVQIARIQAARRAAQAAGIHLVINARTDAYWQAGVDPAEAMRNTLERGKAYLQAGADCIFIPGLRNPDHIRTVIDYLRGVHQDPAINILAGPGVLSIPELAKLGVKRVSYGSGPHRAAMGLLRRIASEANISGTYQALTEGAVSYEEINGLMGK